MAGFMDMLNQGLGNLNTPTGMLGMQLLANSGFQPGATAGSRLGNAFVGMGQQQAQLQQMQMQQQLRQQQAQEIALRDRAMKAQEAQRGALADAMKANPDMAKSLGPLGAAVLQAGGDPADAAAFGKLNGSGQPQMAKMPWTREVPNEDGTTTHMEYDLASGAYKPVSTYKTPTMMNAENNSAKTQQDLQYRPQEFDLSKQRAQAAVDNSQVAQDRVALEQQKAQREADASMFKKKFDRMEFKQQTRSAITDMDSTASLAEEIANDKALNSLYGPNGYIPPVAGSAAADLQAKINRLQAKGGLTELTRLKQNGVSLTPVSNTDLANAQSSFANFDKIQSDVAAREAFLGAAKTIRGSMAEAQQRATEYDSLFDTPSAGTSTAQPKPQGATIVRTGKDSSGRKVVQYSDGRIEYGD